MKVIQMVTCIGFPGYVYKFKKNYFYLIKAFGKKAYKKFLFFLEKKGILDSYFPH